MDVTFIAIHHMLILFSSTSSPIPFSFPFSLTFSWSMLASLAEMIFGWVCLLQCWCIFVYLQMVCNNLFLRRDCLSWQNTEDHYLYMQRFNKILKSTWKLKMAVMMLILTQPIWRLGHLHGKIFLMTSWRTKQVIELLLELYL